MFYALIVVAILIVAIEVFAAKRNRMVQKEGLAAAKWKQVYRWRWLIGIPFAVASAFVSYPMAGETESYKVMGFPLFVAAFDEAGRDYVGPFTGPFFVGNAVIWYFLPQVILYVWVKLRRQNNERA